MRIHVREASTWTKQRLSGPQALIATGRDCECGCPMVWVGDTQTCAVYGSHPPVEQREVAA